MTGINNYIFLKKINILIALVSTPKKDKFQDEFNSIINELINDFNSKELNEIKHFFLNENFESCKNNLNHIKFELLNLLFKKPCANDYFKDLQSTPYNNLKFCKNCNKNVYEVNSLAEIKKRTNLEQCVAFDINSFKSDKLSELKFKSCFIQFEEDWVIGLPNTEIKIDESGIL